MNLTANPARRRRQWLWGPLVLLAMVALSGCQTISYYGQAIKGQYQILSSEQKISKLLADPQTPAPLRAKLQLVEDLRGFALKDLQLPVDKQYAKYVDLHRPYVVWNVQAAPEFSLEPKAWWYPFVGSLEYRGYFKEQNAQKYGEQLRRKGYDVYVDGITAYSTLGWFKDPVLNTFLFDAEASLAETIFHELGHQRLFASGDTDFNEAFATVVGQEGALRWLRARRDAAAVEKYEASLQRERQFVQLIAATRQRLEALYGDERTEEGKIRATKRTSSVPPDQLRQRKREAYDWLRHEYADLKARWGGNTEYDAWFARPLNNAQLNTIANYYDLVPGFKSLLARQGQDLEKFYQAAEKLSKQPKGERHRQLMAVP